MAMDWTGGCLCGAIRYQASAPPLYASYCHCSMCRKATGAPFAGFAQFDPETVTWTEGTPARYQSSTGVIRRFCDQCGSPLTFEAEGLLFITQGSLDHPEQVTFACHTYTSTRLPAIALADGLPQFPGPRGGKGGKPLA